MAAVQRAAHAAALAAAQRALTLILTVKVIQQYLEYRVAQGTALIYYKLFVRTRTVHQIELQLNNSDNSDWLIGIRSRSAFGPNRHSVRLSLITAR
jgi:hypothetical protein